MKSYELGYINDAFEKEREQEEKKEDLNDEKSQDKLEDGKTTKEADQQKAEISESSRCMKISKTVAITFGLVCLGMFLEIVGPSMDYLQDLIGGSTTSMSHVLVARSVGYFTGALVGGYLCDRYSRLMDIFLGVSFLLAAVGTGAAPWCNNAALLGFMFLLTGLAQGTISTGGNSVAINLWGEDTSAPLASQFAAYGVGALIAPQLVNAFIHTSTTSIPLFNSSAPTVDPTTPGNSADYSDVQYAFIIVGFIALAFSIIFFVFYFIDKEGRKNVGPKLDFREILHPGSCADGDTVFSVSFFTLFFIIYLNFCGSEKIFGKYFFKFTTDSGLNFPESKAANIMSLFWICFTVGRSVNMVAGHFLHPVLVMVILVAGNLVNGVLFVIWGNEVETLTWILAGSFGFFLAPLFPAGLTWANQYLQVTAVGISLGYVGGAVGDMVYQYLGGFLMDILGPDALVYLLFGYGCCLTFFYIVTQILASKHGRRSKSKTSSVDTKDDDVIIMTISSKMDVNDSEKKSNQ